MAYALREDLASERQGKDIWFRFWTQIGPCCTADPKERALFPTREAAMGSSAFNHPLSFFEVREVGEEATGDLNWNSAPPVQEKQRHRR